jgi:hypothetical protein
MTEASILGLDRRRSQVQVMPFWDMPFWDMLQKWFLDNEQVLLQWRSLMSGSLAYQEWVRRHGPLRCYGGLIVFMEAKYQASLDDLYRYRLIGWIE